MKKTIERTQNSVQETENDPRIAKRFIRTLCLWTPIDIRESIGPQPQGRRKEYVRCVPRIGWPIVISEFSALDSPLSLVLFQRAIP